MKPFKKVLLCFILSFPTIVFADIIYVNHAAQGLNNGASWQNAFNDLQDALNSLPAPDTIWVAKGTYYPTDGIDRNISYNLPNGVAIFGGFEGTETLLSQRDWETHQTILSGDIGEQGDHSDNSFSILYATMTDTTTTIDGLIIMHGNANSEVFTDPTIGTKKCGGGVYLFGQGAGNFASIKINNCQFLENYAVYYGGAIFFSGFSGSLDYIISNSIFENNEAGNAGGAIGKRAGCNVVQNLVSCKFENNRSEVGGAYWTGETNVAINLNILNCDFIQNQAISGSAIARTNFGANSNDLNIADCLFENNIPSISGYGPVVYDETYSSSGEVYIKNCDFLNGGGEIISCIASESRNLTITHCKFIENKCDCFSRLIEAYGYNLYSINNLFLRNESKLGTCITGVSSTNLVNNLFFKNKATDIGFMINGGEEVTVINSIFWENDTGFFNSGSNLDISASIFDVDSCESIATSGITCHPDVLFNIDPMFRDTANLDFSLLSCSPAINAGLTGIIDSFGILEDLAGNDRIIDGVVDIGAYEQVAFTATLDSVKNESCFGNSNGAVYLSASGNPPFEISWQSGGDSGTNTSNLTPGAYDFFIIDADGCGDTLSVEIEAASGLSTNFESNDASGVDVADGSIDFEVLSGGTPGYTYEWNTGATTSSISDLLPGNYFLTVTDAIFCKYGFAFSVGVTTGIEDLETKNNFQIQPNPAHKYLKIEIENPVSDVLSFQLFDELGRLVLQSDLPALQNQYQISLHHIPDGFYHFNIINNLTIVKKGKLVVLKN